MWAATTGNALVQTGAHRNVFRALNVFAFVEYKFNEYKILMPLAEQDIR